MSNIISKKNTNIMYPKIIPIIVPITVTTKFSNVTFFMVKPKTGVKGTKGAKGIMKPPNFKQGWAVLSWPSTKKVLIKGMRRVLKRISSRVSEPKLQYFWLKRELYIDKRDPEEELEKVMK